MPKPGKTHYPARLVPKLANYPTRKCEYCGKPLTPRVQEDHRRGTERLESKSTFRRRKTCNPTCGQLLRTAKLRTEATRRIKNLIIEFRGMPLSPEDIADELNISPNTTRHQLRKLINRPGTEIRAKPCPDTVNRNLYYWHPRNE